MSQKNKIVQSLSPVANFCPAHPLLPKSRSWLPLVTPVGSVHCSQSLLNWGPLFINSRLLSLLQASRQGRAGQAHPPGLWTLSCPLIITERGWIVSSFFFLSLYFFFFFFLCSCGTWSQFLKSVPKLTSCSDAAVSLFWFLDRFFVNVINLT